MPHFLAFDTNVYINALRDQRNAVLLERILKANGNRLRLPAVVAMELRAGARTEDQRALVESIFDSFARRERIIVPTYSAFLHAGRVIAEIASENYFTSRGDASMLNDALIAASCRESDATLVTHNHSHFELIQTCLRGFRFVDPHALA